MHEGGKQRHAHRLPFPMGGADDFLAFISADMKPLIESELAIDRGRQARFGHSVGGLFDVHVLFTRPESFESYVATSPSITLLQPGPSFGAVSSCGPTAKRAGLRLLAGTCDARCCSWLDAACRGVCW